MFINRRQTINVEKLRQNFGTGLDETSSEILDEFTQFVQLYQVYEAAQNEVATKLENLDAEFSVNYNHNPIHHLEGRMKDPQSLLGKLEKKGLSVSVDEIKRHIFDIAGIRVITNYIDDIYTVERLLTQQDDVNVLKRKDYVAEPKDSGYRSLHLVVEVPVFLSTGTATTPVEIQIRTIGMDMWASLEHKLRYKTSSVRAEQFAQDLITHAEELNKIEEQFQAIHSEI
jgi:putative GTP pyrophosphokinase